MNRNGRSSVPASRKGHASRVPAAGGTPLRTNHSYHTFNNAANRFVRVNRAEKLCVELLQEGTQE